MIDLKHERGLEVFYDLVRRSDVVVDNFRPGVLERMRADYATLAKVNPRIVCCSITGFGGKGPNRDLPSFDVIHQAMSGHMSITGEPGGKPVRVGVPLADLGVALFAVQGILATLLEREKTGLGQRVELSMFESMTFLLGYDATIYLNTGRVRHAWGTTHAHHVPWQVFETSDGWLVVATREEVFWQSFCEAIDRPDLADDPRFARNRDRVANRDELVEILQACLRVRPTADWLAAFRAKQVPSAPVNNFAQALAEPHPRRQQRDRRRAVRPARQRQDAGQPGPTVAHAHRRLRPAAGTWRAHSPSTGRRSRLLGRDDRRARARGRGHANEE